MTPPALVTTLGDLTAEQVGWMLAHEHVFANFTSDEDGGADAATVAQRLRPALERARAAGLTALADATAIGGARRPDIALAVSQAAGMPLLLATGIFKDPAKAERVRLSSEGGLRDWMICELTEAIDGAPVRAGWVKLSVTDSGVQPYEAVLLRAAAAASQYTGAAVGSHTVGAALANAELDIFEAAGGSPSRFIWIHTQTEPDFAAHVAFARRGAWIEYDAIDNGAVPDERYVDWICALLAAGLGGQVLLSHDRGGYHPAQPEGGALPDYTYLVDVFIPKLRARGVAEAEIDRLLRENPFRAYAR